MSLSVNFTPTKTILCENACPQYSSRWVAAHNPIVFKLSSSLFPVASGAVQLAYINVTESQTGNARFAYLNFGSFDAADLIPGQFVKVSGAYSGEFRVIKFDPGNNTIELSTSFVGTGSGTITKAYRNYVAELKVFAGLPNSHKWKALKPETEIETLQQIPDQSGVAIFDIREAVQKKLNTLNNFELASLPNDVNIWTGFRVSYQERYDTASGETGVLANITATGEVGGKQEFTIDAGLDLIAGDFVVLQNFNDDDLNGAVIRVVSDDGADVVLDLFYTGWLTLNGYETMQKFSTQTVSFQGGFAAEGNQYYAINAKLAPRSRYAGNMGEYLNNQNKTRPIKWISGFEGKKTWAGYYDDLGAIIDKTLTDSLATTETLAVQVVEKDRNGAVLDTQYLHIPNQEEGVYRLPYVQGIPPFIYELNSAVVISHLSYRRPAEFQYPPVAVDTSTAPTIDIDGTVQSARGDNFRFDANGRTATRNREQFSGQCLRVEATNAGCFWSFAALGLTGVMTATVAWYKDSGGVVTLNKTLTGADPEIDNTNKRFIPQTNYRYHDLTVFEDGALFGRYLLEQRHNAVLLDSSGNGEHKTGSSVVTPALLWTSDNVPVSYANGDAGGFGYSAAAGTEIIDGTTLTAGEIIPAITASLDAIGGVLQYRGRCAIDGKLTNSPCIILAEDEELRYNTFVDLTQIDSVVNDGTATLTIDKPNRILIATAGTCWNIRHLDSSGNVLGHNPVSEGKGSILCDVTKPTYVNSYDLGIGVLDAVFNWSTQNEYTYNQAVGANKDLVLYEQVNTPVVDAYFDGLETFGVPAGDRSFDTSVGTVGGRDNVQILTLTPTTTIPDWRFYTNPTFFSSQIDRLTAGFNVRLSFDYYATGDVAGLLAQMGQNKFVANSLGGFVADAWTSFLVETPIRSSGYFIVGTTNLIGFWIPSSIKNGQIAFDNFKIEIISAIPALSVGGQDVLGNPLPASSGFVIQDFGNSLKVNPNNVPLLRAGFGVDDTEELTYAQIVESVTGSGLDRFVKGGDTVEDYILADADTATPDDIAQIQNYENR